MDNLKINKAIIHADFDAFYASVEQRDESKLVGKPVLVGGSPDSRGVVASASYEARGYGIRSAMPMSRAIRLCPQAIMRRPRFDVYRDVSKHVMEIFRTFTPLVEPLSLDEAYLDITEKQSSKLTPPVIAKKLKQKVFKELRLTISAGVSTSKAVSKIASDMDKPDGLTVVRPGEERNFLNPLPIESLWGIGPKTKERINQQGIYKISEMSSQSDLWFSENFGINAELIKLMSLGIDDRPVVIHKDRKSYSSETTLNEDTGDVVLLKEIVSRLSQDVSSSLMKKGISGKTVKLKLRTSDFSTFTRQVSFLDPVQLASEISEYATRLLEYEIDEDIKFRLLGVGVSGFGHLEMRQDNQQMRLEGF
ncbi:MAG: DNA polymerase IV [Dehalococcoidia bacterium]